MMTFNGEWRFIEDENVRNNYPKWCSYPASRRGRLQKIPSLSFIKERLQSETSYNRGTKLINALPSLQIGGTKGVFQKLVKLLGQVDTGFLPSRWCNQVLRYVRWHPDPQIWMTNVSLLNWNNLRSYVFPSFPIIGRMLAKVIQ